VTAAWLRAAVVSFAVAVAAGAAAQDAAPPPAVSRHASADGRVSIELPTAWTVSPGKDRTEAVISLRLEAPAGSLVLEVFHVPGVRDARAQAYHERATQPRRYETDAPALLRLDPLPHVTLDCPKPGLYAWHAWIYRVIDRNGFTVVAYCDPKTWDGVKASCFNAARSLTSSLPPWPGGPPGYRSSERDGYEYFVGTEVKDSTIAAFHAALLEREKRFTALHGPVPKPAWNRPVIVLSAHRSGTDAAAGREVRADYYADPYTGVLYGVPYRKDEPVARAQLAYAAAELLHSQAHSYLASDWVRAGERRVAYAEGRLARGLPSWPADSVRETLPNVCRTLDSVIREKDFADRVDQATAYVALFHAGPKPWREAFAAYSKELSATGDWEAAERNHLLSLDQDKLRAAAQAFLKELKLVETK
jgi:hypothetical protein